MKPLYLCLIMAGALLFTACRHQEPKIQEQFSAIESVGIDVDRDLLLGDTLALPDIYCGDSKQDNEVEGVELSTEQYEALVVPAGPTIADAMSKWVLLGVRAITGGNFLAAYYAGNGMGYTVNLLTYDKSGKLLDAINLRELHLVWRRNVADQNDNNSFTLDSRVTFKGNDRLTLHRLMGHCIMDYEQGLKSEPSWQSGWDQDYIIDGDGHFVIERQHATTRKGNVEDYAVMDFRTWDLLICSPHDQSIMDLWNDFVPQVESVYTLEYAYNPFPWDVMKLYEMNPQRFLNWMAAVRDNDNRLLPYFKLRRADRPVLLEEIGHLKDPEARQWLTDIVNAWDDTPLTAHY